METCGLCHARRSQISEDWVPGRWLSDTHVVSGLTRETFHADGQIRDTEEPYNYQPFKQSRMFAAGVTCGDCHDPHSARLRAPGEGVCLQCHTADKYAGAGQRRLACGIRSEKPDVVSLRLPDSVIGTGPAMPFSVALTEALLTPADPTSNTAACPPSTVWGNT